MNLLSSIDPSTAKSTALAWIETAAAVATGAIMALSIILPKLAALKTQVQTLFDLHRDNSTSITTLALHTPPPAPPAAEALEANTEATKENTTAVEGAQSPQ